MTVELFLAVSENGSTSVSSEFSLEHDMVSVSISHFGHKLLGLRGDDVGEYVKLNGLALEEIEVEVVGTSYTSRKYIKIPFTVSDIVLSIGPTLHKSDQTILVKISEQAK